MRLCAESVLSKSVWSIYFAFSRVYYLHSSRYSVWGFDLRMFDDCLYSVRRFDLRLCANFVLSGSVWPINFPLPRVYDLADDLPSSWYSVWRFDLRLCDESLYSVICVYVTNLMNTSLVITLECPVFGRVVNKRSCITCLSGFPSQSQPRVCSRRGCLIP